MSKKRILYIGDTKTHNEYTKGNVPSHWFYGAVEMERDGHNVIWCNEEHDIYNDFKLIKAHKHDLIFIPNLNIQAHFLLLTLASLGIYRKPIYAYLHREPAKKRGIKSFFYKFILKGVKHVFFLSEKSMEETITAGLLKPTKCSVPGWGPDMNFYSNIETSDNGWFVSTGKENRDFDILVEVFRITGASLRIFTVPSNFTSHYEYLKETCRNIPNIEVTILENTSANYPMMVKEMAAAKALVCSLRNDKLNYCVGLSTIADAEGLGKPLIITNNPYHDRRNSQFNTVATVEEWVDAIKNLKSPTDDVPTMENAYNHMKFVMHLS